MTGGQVAGIVAVVGVAWFGLVMAFWFGVLLVFGARGEPGIGIEIPAPIPGLRAFLIKDMEGRKALVIAPRWNGFTLPAKRES